MGIAEEQSLLTVEDETRLARVIEAGVLAEHAMDEGHHPSGAMRAELGQLVVEGRRAHDEFFTANLPLVRALVHRWAGRTNLPWDDLFQEGCLALAEAVMRWDNARGTRFSTLAWGMINRALAASALVRCGELDSSHHRARLSFEIRRTWASMEAELGRIVSASEVAGRMGRGMSLVHTVASEARTIPLTHELAEQLAESHPDRPSAESSPPWWMDRLPRDERVVLCGRFGLGEPAVSRAALAERLGISRSTVTRIERRGLNHARHLLIPD
ncbi:RNA polymerase sporulation sigma factor SigF [Brooklawnia cerclae]|uniref:RNA polymerase sigma factor (Sigma-70 family) n=1 Tax=Brooklawnia cerclae TaxID=349934 RepID=A0ABX0SCP9_9ACTN|nr:sigma-70 family RNA polymerase sigma factor [Brooklawnia cerclae]NIH56173.1 RNA polymerase sigma factor (sigma-70 family) [Brooklawnia cerclae]